MRKGNKERFVMAIFSFIVIVFMSGCNDLPFFKKKQPVKREAESVEVQGTVLTKVNGSVITLEDFNKRIDNIKNVYPDIKFDEFKDKKAFLDELVKRELLYQEAMRKGLNKKQEVVDAIDDFKREVLAAQLIDDETSNVKVEAKEIEDYYNTFKDEFTSPDERQVREIIVPTEDRARQILIELLNGQDFATLAMTDSISPSSKEGGDIGFIKKGEKQGRYGEKIFVTEVGEISSVFKVPEGHAVIKVEDKKGGESRSLSEAWNDIEEGLLRLKKYQQILKIEDELRMKAKLEINEDLLR